MNGHRFGNSGNVFDPARYCTSGTSRTGRRRVSCRSRAGSGPVEPGVDVTADVIAEWLFPPARGSVQRLEHSPTDGRPLRATMATNPAFGVRGTSDGWAVCGEIDLATAPRLAAALSAARPDLRGARARLDLARVCFIDSHGLAVLLNGHRTARGPHDRFVIHRASRVVRRLVEITDLGEALCVRPDDARRGHRTCLHE